MTERGFTIIELLISLALLVALSGIVGGVGMTIHARERTSAAYAEDLGGMRRAARHLQDDLRAAASILDIDYRLEAGRLLRGQRALLRNVASFQLSSRGRMAHVTLTLAPRSDAPTRREAKLSFAVRMRGVKQ